MFCGRTSPEDEPAAYQTQPPRCPKRSIPRINRKLESSSTTHPKRLLNSGSLTTQFRTWFMSVPKRGSNDQNIILIIAIIIIIVIIIIIIIIIIILTWFKTFTI